MTEPKKTARQFNYIIGLARDLAINKEQLKQMCIEAFGCDQFNLDKEQAKELIRHLRARFYESERP